MKIICSKNIFFTIYIKIIIMNSNKTIWDVKSKQYSAKSEKICDEYFSTITGLTGWFSCVVKMPEYFEIDYKSIDSRFRTVTIELKNRTISISDYDSIIIEKSKFNALTGQTTDKSWYINFIENTPDKFWIVDIKNIMNKPMKKKKMDIKINDLGNDYTYNDERIFINKYYGHYYEFDQTQNKYIKKW